jgi:hypothetical protein
MTLKKMTLLAGMALAAIASAAPATASAQKTDGTHWTNGTNHPVVGNGVTMQAPFEGFIDFTIPPPGVPVHSTFGCEVTGIVEVRGPTTAEITKFDPTTTTCVGTGIFTTCKLKAHTNNVPWNVVNTRGNTSAQPPTVSDFHATKTGGDVTVRYEFEGCAGGAVPPFDPAFASITLTPTLDGNGTVTKLTISGKDTSGFVTATGSMDAKVTGEKIGVKTIEVID